MMVLPALALPQAFTSLDVITLILRLAFVLLVYVFLYQVARVSIRELVVLGRITSPSESQVAALPSPAACLEIIDGADAHVVPGERLMLDAYATIGRNDTNTISIDDGFISGSHADIAFDNGSWWIQDLGSTNGTFVNGQPIQGRTRIADGDVIQFGRVQTRAHL